MKTCQYCGAVLDDNATFCAACGTTFAPANSIPAFDGSVSSGNVVKKIVIAVIAVAVAVALFLVLFLGISGTGFAGLSNSGIQSLISDYNKAYADQDGEKYAEIWYPDEAYDFYTDENEDWYEPSEYHKPDYDNAKDEKIGNFEDSFDYDPMDSYTDEELDDMDSEERDRLDARVLLNDATKSYKIRKVEKASDSKFKDAKKYYKKKYGIEITALKKVKVEMTYKGLSKDDEEQIKDAGLSVVSRITRYAYKYEGKWYLCETSYFDY